MLLFMRLLDRRINSNGKIQKNCGIGKATCHARKIMVKYKAARFGA